MLHKKRQKVLGIALRMTLNRNYGTNFALWKTKICEYRSRKFADDVVIIADQNRKK